MLIGFRALGVQGFRGSGFYCRVSKNTSRGGERASGGSWAHSESKSSNAEHLELGF